MNNNFFEICSLLTLTTNLHLIVPQTFKKNMHNTDFTFTLQLLNETFTLNVDLTHYGNYVSLFKS